MNRLWLPLAVISHVAFWVSALVWFGAAGQAGSPLPDNWRTLLFVSHVADASAIVSLVASTIFACLAYWKGKKSPNTAIAVGVVSVALLVLTARFWVMLLADNNF